ncbi:hypothetical protein PSQ40_00525 [Curvibacter sp. HBC61]|uniref:Prepilin-type cleavage/methylation domain-containing protein n=1 Tax=Curvibacter cyanobacteriorum TaxID=3026422 RepID=A0ABT5MSM1_9BURK|nr:hypothetical protein [Curvibacter sp. HBC61]MDD0837045.1 hypothetical protein [Curvibacter sp. HBC61]
MTPWAVRPHASAVECTAPAAPPASALLAYRAGPMPPTGPCGRGGLLIEVLLACAALAFASQALLLTQLRSLLHQHGAASRWQAQVLATDWLERLSLHASTVPAQGGVASGWTPVEAPQACDAQGCDPASLLRWQQADWQQWSHGQLPQGGAGLWLGDSPSVALGVALHWQDRAADATARAALNPAALAAGAVMACPEAQLCALHWRAP